MTDILIVTLLYTSVEAQFVVSSSHFDVIRCILMMMNDNVYYTDAFAISGTLFSENPVGSWLYFNPLHREFSVRLIVCAQSRAVIRFIFSRSTAVRRSSGRSKATSSRTVPLARSSTSCTAVVTTTPRSARSRTRTRRTSTGVSNTSNPPSFLQVPCLSSLID